MTAGKQDRDAQRRRFEEAARKLGCDESEEKFEEQLRDIAKAKPKAKGPSKKPGPS